MSSVAAEVIIPQQQASSDYYRDLAASVVQIAESTGVLLFRLRVGNLRFDFDVFVGCKSIEIVYPDCPQGHRGPMALHHSSLSTILSVIFSFSPSLTVLHSSFLIMVTPSRHV